MAKHPNAVEEVGRLVATGEIQSIDGKHLRLPLLGLAELAGVMPQAESVCYLCSHLFGVLRSAFIDRPTDKLSVTEIAELAEMPERQVATAFTYLLDAPIFESWATGNTGLHRDIVVSEGILNYSTFDEVVDAMRAMRRSSQPERSPSTQEASRMKKNSKSAGNLGGTEDMPTHSYIDSARLDELRACAWWLLPRDVARGDCHRYRESGYPVYSAPDQQLAAAWLHASRASRIYGISRY